MLGIEMKPQAIRDIIVVGFGSMGRRHTLNLIELGCRPLVITKHPDSGVKNADFVKSSKLINPKKYSGAIICTETSKHLEALEELAELGVKNFLIEKPIEKNIQNAEKIRKLAAKLNLKIFVGYNMRFLGCFGLIRKFVEESAKKIRLVNIVSGQFLPDWRPSRDYRSTYSADRKLGGGVDLDLSHEVDYMLWLFGKPTSHSVTQDKISSLEIKSPDVFKGIYKFNELLAIVELDYIRKVRERYIHILGEDSMLTCDFVKQVLTIEDFATNKKMKIEDKKLFDMTETYKSELKAFMKFIDESTNDERLTTLEEAIDVLKYILGGGKYV
jgi:predicted dehydrogenase